MRIIGWLAMALLSRASSWRSAWPPDWVIRGELQTRVHELVASADAGLARSAALTDVVSGNIAAVSTRVGDVKARADQLVITPADGPIATGLATAINDFITGPYTVLRTEYSALRERVTTVGEQLQALDLASPAVTLPGTVIERLQEMDARLQEIDAAVTAVGEATADGVAAPGIASRISERAAEVQQVVTGADEIVSDVAAKIQEELQVRLAAADDNVSTALTVGAGVGLILTFGFYFAGLNVLLFRQGRRWSRQESTSPA